LLYITDGKMDLEATVRWPRDLCLLVLISSSC